MRGPDISTHLVRGAFRLPILQRLEQRGLDLDRRRHVADSQYRQDLADLDADVVKDAHQSRVPGDRADHAMKLDDVLHELPIVLPRSRRLERVVFSPEASQVNVGGAIHSATDGCNLYPLSKLVQIVDLLFRELSHEETAPGLGNNQALLFQKTSCFANGAATDAECRGELPFDEPVAGLKAAAGDGRLHLIPGRLDKADPPDRLHVHMSCLALSGILDRLFSSIVDCQQYTSYSLTSTLLTTSEEVLKAALTASDCLSVTPHGELAIEGCTATDLLARFGSPLFVLSDRTLRQNVRRIRQAFESNWPSPVNVMYAIKCNPNFAVRAVVHEEGAGGDCFGMGELEATFAGGADPDKIALNGSNKDDAVIARAIELGININMDAASEPERIERIAASMARVVRVNIRLKVIPPEYAHYDSDLMGFNGDFREELRRLKWGVSESTAERMIGDMQRCPHLELTGYHSHLGRLSQRVEDRAAYDREFARAVVRIHRKTDFSPGVLDLGGGWPRERDPESRTLELNRHTIEDYAEATCQALRGEFEPAGIALPALWLEPGRYIAGNAGVLLTTVESIKREDGFIWLYVDASTNIMPLLGAAVEGTYNHVLSATRMREPLEISADVVGPLCIPSVLRNDCQLPDVETGDVIAILDAGMYAESDSHQLNWIPRPTTVMVRGGEVGVVREAETLESIFATQRLPKWLQRVNSPPSKYRERAIAEDRD